MKGSDLFERPTHVGELPNTSSRNSQDVFANLSTRVEAHPTRVGDLQHMLGHLQHVLDHFPTRVRVVLQHVLAMNPGLPEQLPETTPTWAQTKALGPSSPTVK